MKNTVDARQKAVSASREQSFFEDVWDVVRQVPPGRVTTYGAIAKYLGTKMSARMVGWALNAAHYVQPPIPAQRVVNRMGMLSGKGHFNPPSSMQEALEKEGLVIKDDVIQDFTKHFWDPYTELSL